MGIWTTKSLEDLVAQGSEKGKLKRVLGARELIMLGIGAIIGTGIFVITGVAAAKYAGPAIIVSFVVAGIASVFAALVYAELASMVPVAGSAYTYSYTAMGELIAWIIGWDLILEYTVAASAVAIGWSGYFVSLLKSVGLALSTTWTASPFAGGIVNLPAVLVVLFLVILVIYGTREATKLNNLVVTIKLAVISLFLILGVFHVRPVNWTSFTPFGIRGVMTGAGIIFFAYIGFDMLSTSAEEVRNPARDLPLGIITSLLMITSVLYIAVSVVLTGMVSYTRLNTPSPIAFALLNAGIRWGSALVSMGALAGLTSVILVNIYGQSRVFFAMARDGLLPQSLAYIHPRWMTPYRTTLVTGAAIMALAAMLPIGVVAELANIGTLTAFVLVSIGVLVLRKTRPDAKRPFRTPFVPYVPVLSIIFSVALAMSLPKLTWIRFAAWFSLGLVIYLLYGRHHSVASHSRGGSPGRLSQHKVQE